MKWYSKENLKKAWDYAKIDIRDDFIFDIINYEDIKQNLEHIITSLHTKIRDNQYYPALIIRINVPKNDHSVRPGTVIPIVDLIVLYAIAQQLAPFLDNLLSDSAYAYRFNPKVNKSSEPLFKDKVKLHNKELGENTENNKDLENETAVEVSFPSGWFKSWKSFHESSKLASKEYQHVAVTDITAYFENISLDLLREILKEKLNNDEHFSLIDRLFRLLEYWDWNPTGNLPRKIGLPQGNDVSSFLSNLYLITLDKEMIEIVSGDNSKYGRYIDDIKIFTSNKDEARRALVKLEEVLRSLNLNVQSAKTEIKPAKDIFNDEIELWLENMDEENNNKANNAVEFFETIFNKNELSKWQRPYSRCLTVLRKANDDRAVNIALDLFLRDPSHVLLIKNFTYLRNFIASKNYGQEIINRLLEKSFTFPYHRALMYRLAAYSRDNVTKLKELALKESKNNDLHWFCRMAALFCLGTFPLSREELAFIEKTVESEANPQVIRVSYIILTQHSGNELKWVLDRVSLFNSPHQEYLGRYLLNLYKDNKLGLKFLSKIKGRSISAPTFIHNLHLFDLLKASSNIKNREIFKQVIENKIKECENKDWPRLKNRLDQIYNSFVLNP